MTDMIKKRIDPSAKSNITHECRRKVNDKKVFFNSFLQETSLSTTRKKKWNVARNRWTLNQYCVKNKTGSKQKQTQIPLFVYLRDLSLIALCLLVGTPVLDHYFLLKLQKLPSPWFLLKAKVKITIIHI